MSTKLTKLSILTLYTLLIVCMGFATILEKTTGSQSAESIYHSWWFIGLWTALIVVSLIFIVHKKMHKRLAVLLLHLSFVIILIGAFITHITAESGSIHLRTSQPMSHFTNDEGNIRQLPFSMTMTDFTIQNYPGTDAVMDYCCEIDVVGEDKSAGHMSVSMNNIGKFGGYRFYQSSYDYDCEGSQLLVAYDPYGIAVTYIGYICLFISLLWAIVSKQSRIAQLYRQATKPLVLLLLLLTVPSQINAQETITPINKKIANEFSHVAVLYNGRICPLNTAANDFVTKLCGKSSWNGYSANDIFVGWMIYYTQWETQKIIKVKSGDVQRLLGINGKWASVSDFYTYDHTYKLSGKANDTSLPASTRKAIREVDEKLNVVSMFYNSEMLHIFPLKVDGKMGWYTPGSTELPLGTPEAEFQFINHAMDHLTQAILVDDAASAIQIIKKIKLYQKEKATDIMPSPSTLSLEVFYNTIQQTNIIVYLFLTFSLILCMLSLAKGGGGKLMRIVHTTFIISAILWLTLLLALRWWVSGHVPISNGFETMLFMAWATLAITLFVMKSLPVVMALGPVVSSFCMLVATIALDSPQITNLMPVLQSPLLSIHVAVVMISYALFAMVTLIAVYSLILHRNQRLAELDRMTALSSLLLYPAVSLLAIGIFVGAVWANVSWGTYWSWDPKETWALITLMIYSIPLHRSFMPSSAVKHHLYILIAFLAVLMTYFGVNYLLPGMHSYA